jgi:hypothetical protein
MMKVAPRSWVPLGYQQITSLGSAVGLTVPSGATCALIQSELFDVRWRDDGTNPTASVGMLLTALDVEHPGSAMWYVGDLTKLKFIEASAGAKLDISYYR